MTNYDFVLKLYGYAICHTKGSYQEIKAFHALERFLMSGTFTGVSIDQYKYPVLFAALYATNSYVTTLNGIQAFLIDNIGIIEYNKIFSKAKRNVPKALT